MRARTFFLFLICQIDRHRQHRWICFRTAKRPTKHNQPRQLLRTSKSSYAHIHITTPHHTPSMLTTRGSSSNGASTAGSKQEASVSMDIDPTPGAIDVDDNEDNNQTHA